MQMYKVFTNWGGTLVSCVARGKLRVVYAPGLKSVAPVGGLFVFSEYDDAVSFAIDVDGEVWEVECGDTREIYKILLFNSITYDYAMEFWGNEPGLYDCKDPVEGTLVTDWVIPIKMVHKPSGIYA